MKKKLLILTSVLVIFLLSACSVGSFINVLEILILNPNPQSGSTEVTRSFNLTWDVQTNVEAEILSYTVYLDQNPNPNTVIGTTENKTIHIDGLSYSTTYYWRVVANHQSGIQKYGPIWNFTTEDEPVVQGQLRGITVGVTNYGGINDLDYPDDDTAIIEITFENLENEFSVQTQTGTVTKANIINSLNAFVADSSSNDVFLFQYSGHGEYANDQSNLYLSDGLYLSMLELRTALSAINGTKIVLIDACESGNFTNLSSGRSLTMQERIEQIELFNKGVIEAFKEDPNTRADYESDYEYYVLTGAAINQAALEDSDLNNGIFTFFFTDGLGNVGSSNPNGSFDYSYDADGYGPNGILNEEVTYTELYHYSKDKVQNYLDAEGTGEIQTIQGNHPNADFVIGIY